LLHLKIAVGRNGCLFFWLRIQNRAHPARLTLNEAVDTVYLPLGKSRTTEGSKW